MSIVDCLIKLGIDEKHEDAILRGIATKSDNGEFDGDAETSRQLAVAAIDAALADAYKEKSSIVRQIKKAGGTVAEEEQVEQQPEAPAAETPEAEAPSGETTGTSGGTPADAEPQPEPEKKKREREIDPATGKPVKAERKKKKANDDSGEMTAAQAVEAGETGWLADEIYDGVLDEVTAEDMPVVFPDDHLVRIPVSLKDPSIRKGVEENLKRLGFRITDRMQETEQSERMVISAMIQKAAGLDDDGQELGGKVKGKVPPPDPKEGDEKEFDKKLSAWLKSLHPSNYANPESNEEQTFGALMFKEAVLDRVQYPLAYIASKLRDTQSGFSYRASDKEVLSHCLKAGGDKAAAVQKFAEEYTAALTDVQNTIHEHKTVGAADAALRAKYLTPDPQRDGDWIFSVAGQKLITLMQFSSYRGGREFSAYLAKYAEAFKNEDSTDQTNRVKKKDPDMPPRLENIVRVGMEDHRQGKDVDTDNFMEAFGFKGVEFGEWVNQLERQQNLNLAYDSLLDLAKLTGLSPKVVGLANRLGMAIGARGSKNTRAAAHYEPDSNVINLTKTKGNGTVGHEWFHGLDKNARGIDPTFGAAMIRNMAEALEMRIRHDRVNDKLRGILSQANGEKGRTTPPKQAVFEMLNPRNRYVATLLDDSQIRSGTRFFAEARKMDEGKNERYWSKNEEMLARGFESFLYDKSKGGTPYLVGGSRAEGYMSPKNGYPASPYPFGDERQYVYELYEDLFSMLDGETLTFKPYKVEAKVVHVEGLGYTVIDQHHVGDGYTKHGEVGALKWHKTEEEAKTAAEAINGTDRYLRPVAKQLGLLNKESLNFAQNIDSIMEEMGIVKWPEIKNGSMAESMFFHLRQGWWPADNRQLKEYVAKAYGVKPEDVDRERLKNGQEDFEAALARFAGQRIVDMRSQGSGESEIYAELVSLYNKQMELNVRTSTSAMNQAYSTPLPIAYIAGLLGRINPNSKVVDPTGGNGLLMIAANPKNVTTIELDKRRANNMALMQIGKVIEGDATKKIAEINDQAGDTVLMNPPFGSLPAPVAVPSWNGKEYMMGKIDHLIAAKAMRTMADKGRAVIILGANKKVGAVTMPDRIFLNWLYANYNVTDHFEVEGAMYRKMGAEWPLRVLVVSGRNQTDSAYDMNAQVERVFDYDQLWSRYVQAHANSERVLVGSRKPTDSAGGANNGTGSVQNGDQGQAGNPDREGGAGVGNTDGGGNDGRAGSDGTASGETSGRGGSATPADGSAGRGDSAQKRRSRQGESGNSGAGGVSGTGAKPTDTGGLSGVSDADIESIFDDVFGNDAAPAAGKSSGQTSSTPTGEKRTRAVGKRRESTGDPELDAIFADMDKVVEGKSKPARKPKEEKPSATVEQAAEADFVEASAMPTFGDFSRAYHDQLAPAIKAAEAHGGSIETLSTPMFSRSSGVDDAKYDEYKPFFQRIMEAMRKKYSDTKDQIRNFAVAVLGRYGAKIKAYAMKFIGELKAEEKVFVSTKKPIIPDPVDNEAQVVYRGRSRGNSAGIYVPRAQATALYSALDKVEAEYGDIDQFVMEELGYESEQALYAALGGYQIDALALAIAEMKNGNGFIIGDDTGVGKGRTGAALMTWAIKNGKIPVFFTIKPELFSAMYEDLHDIGKGDTKFAITNIGEQVKFKKKTLLKTDSASAKALYKHIIENNALPDGAQALFTTYSQVNDAKDTDRKRALAALVRSGKAVIIMDEAHNAAGDSNIGKFIKGLITGEGLFGADSDGNFNEPPEDFVSPPTVYLSATFAKRAANIPLYVRTHLSKAADSMEELVDAFAAGGDVLQQIASAMLVKAGSMIRRERSYEGVSFAFVTDERNAERDARQVDAVTNVMRAIVRADRAFTAWMETKEGRQTLESLVPAGYQQYNKNGQLESAINHANFTSIAHNYINQLLLATKIDTAVEHAVTAINSGEKPVFALQNTMESALADYADMAGLKVGDTLENFGWQSILTRGVNTARRVTFKSPNGKKGDDVRMVIPTNLLPPEVEEEFRRCEGLIEEFQSDLPASPIDMLRHKLSQYYVVTDADGKKTVTKKPAATDNARPMVVAEITGRELTVDYSQTVQVLSKRDDPDAVDVVGGFGDGTVDIVILNSSGSTGISLHASEKWRDQRTRRMIVLQPNPDIAVFKQTIGRIHRTGQVEWPAFTVLATGIPAERRILAILKKKMKSLFSNTSAGKGSTEIDAVDFINIYGDRIVAEYMMENDDAASFIGLNIPDPKEAEGTDFAQGASNRVTLLSVDEQRDFFDTVEDRFLQEMAQRDAAGTNRLNMSEYNFQATPVETMVLEEGMDESNPFTESVYLTKYEINVIGDIPSPAKVRAAIEHALNGRTPSEVVADIDNTLKTKYDEAYNQLILRRDAINVEKANPAASAAEIASLEGRLAALEETMSGFAMRREMTLRQLKNNYPIGGGFYGMTVGDIETDGIIVGYQVSNKSSKTGNPFSPSNISVIIQRNIPNGRLTVPLSKLEAGIEIRTGGTAYTNMNIDDTFAMKSVSGGRRQRYIVTGNLIRGLGLIQSSGDIIKFTMEGHTEESPRVENGILLPEKYKPDASAKSGFAFRSKLAATDFVLNSMRSIIAQKYESTGYDAYKTKLDTIEAAIKVRTEVSNQIISDIGWSPIIHDRKKAVALRLDQYDGSIQLSVHTAIHPRLFKSKELVALVGNLSKGRKDTHANVTIRDPEKIKPVIDLIYKHTNLMVPDQAAEIARELAKSHHDLDAGTKPTFSRSTTQAAGITKAAAQEIVNAMRAKWANAPEIIVVDDMNDPAIRKAVRDENQRQLSQGAKGQPEGFFDAGKVYVVASELNKPADVVRVVFHETLGHYGLRGLYGKELEGILKQIVMLRRADVERKAKQYGLDITVEKDALIAAEEVLAEMAQTKPEIGFVRKAIAAIRTWLRNTFPRLFFQLGLSDAEIIQNYLLPARQFVTDPKGGGGGGVRPRMSPAMSRAAGSQIRTPEFRRWFGDSKVVDENGEPLVVYHGTGDSLSKILNMRGAIYFTPDPKFAEGFAYNAADSIEEGDGYNEEKFGKMESAGANILPVYLSVQNPFDPRNPAHVDMLIEEAGLGRNPAGREIWRKRFSAGMYDDLEGYYDTMQELGFDGFYEKEGPDQEFWNIGVFSPTQIKSAIGNNGQFDPNNPDIRFSRAPASFDAPEQSKLDSLIYTLQDKHIDLRRVTEAIKESSGDIEDNINPYMQEELFHGRTAKRVKNFINDELQPLIDDMRARNVTMADFEEYLWARHAEERNIQIAKINPDMPDGGSGMTTQEARDYLDSLTQEQADNYTALAARVDAMNQRSRQVLVEYGLESQETIDTWQETYTHYVPLMREDMDSPMAGSGTGQGYSVRGNASKRATGSGRAVVDILANIAQQRERNIIRGEKNRVATALVGLVAENPNDEFWKVDSPPKIKTIQTGATTYKVKYHGSVVEEFSTMEAARKFVEWNTKGYDASAYEIDAEKAPDRVVSIVDPNYKSRENVVVARIPNDKGKIVERAVVFNQHNPRALRMAMSLKNLDQDQLGEVLSASAKVTRYFASVNTQYNPVFGVINLIRDTQGAMLNLSATPLDGKQAEVSKNVWSALKGIYSDIRRHRAGQQPNSQWAQLWAEFQFEGGQTGYRDMFRNARERAEAIEKSLDPDWWMSGTAGKILTANGFLAPAEKVLADNVVKPVFDWLSDYNEAMENAVRLAAYKAAKDSGMTNQEAASLAKNLTVNFNRRGEAGRQIGALYAFFNASVQGTARIAQTLAGKGGKRILIGGLTLGVMQAIMLADFDDEEPPQWERDRNLIIPTGDGTYIKIAMPLGFNAIPAFGRIMTEWAMGGFKKEPSKVLVHVLDMLLDVTNPIGNAGMSLQTIAPTALDPLAALAENKDWTGRPIAREDVNSLDPTAGHTRAKDTASTPARLLSEAINYATGGTDFKPGAMSPTPDQIDYLIGQVFGGVGRETLKLEQTLTSAVTGEELPVYKIPLVGRFAGSAAGQAAQGGMFYENVRNIHMHENEIIGRRKAGEDTSEYLAANPDAKLIFHAKRAETMVRNLRKQRRALIDSGASRAQIMAVDAQITTVMKGLNDAVRSVKRTEPAL